MMLSCSKQNNETVTEQDAASHVMAPDCAVSGDDLAGKSTRPVMKASSMPNVFATEQPGTRRLPAHAASFSQLHAGALYAMYTM